MRYGMPIASGLGEPENWLSALVQISATNGDTYVQPVARPGWGDAFFQIYNNAQPRKITWIPEGGPFPLIRVMRNPGLQPSICVLRIGAAEDPSFACSQVVREYEEQDSPKVRIGWTWRPLAAQAIGDEGHTSSWTFSNLLLSQTLPWPGNLFWRTLYVDIVVASGSATVQVTNLNNDVIMSGTGTLGSTIVLTNQDGTTAAGTVYVDGTTISVTDAQLIFRYPLQMRVLRDAMVEATVDNLMRDNMTDWVEPDDLANGTYAYSIQPVSDSGVDGAVTAIGNQTIAVPPENPTDLRWKATTTVAGLHGVELKFWNTNQTPGTTYTAYTAPIGGRMNLESGYSGFSGFSGAGYSGFSGQGVLPPAAIGYTVSNYSGIAYAIVRAQVGGVEEKNAFCLPLVMDGTGIYIGYPPNIGSLSDVSYSGLSITATGAITASVELSDPAITMILANRTDTGSYNWAVPLATGTLGAIDKNGNKTCSFSATIPAGMQWIATRAVTAAGTMGEISEEVLVVGSTSVLTGGSGTAARSRG